jgi:hypothetical protein
MAKAKRKCHNCGQGVLAGQLCATFRGGGGCTSILKNVCVDCIAAIYRDMTNNLVDGEFMDRWRKELNKYAPNS